MIILKLSESYKKDVNKMYLPQVWTFVLLVLGAFGIYLQIKAKKFILLASLISFIAFAAPLVVNFTPLLDSWDRDTAPAPSPVVQTSPEINADAPSSITTSEQIPHQVEPTPNFTSPYEPAPITVAITAGHSHTIALRDDGTVWTWGRNSSSQIGDGTFVNRRYTPVQVSGLSNIIAISASERHSIALRNDNTIWGWGSNSDSQLGDGTTSTRNVPIRAEF